MSRSARISNVASPQNEDEGEDKDASLLTQYIKDEDEQNQRSTVVHILNHDGSTSTGLVVKQGIHDCMLTCFHSLAVDGIIDQSKVGSVVATLHHKSSGAVAGERLQSVEARVRATLN